MLGTRPEQVAEPKDLFQQARSSYGKAGQRTVPVHFYLTMAQNAPTALDAWDEDGHTVHVTGDVPQAARTRSITQEDVCQRLQKTGGTGFQCVDASAQVEDGLSLSAASINALRRDALDALTKERTTPPTRRVVAYPTEVEHTCTSESPRFTVSITTMAQASEELLSMAPARVYVPLDILGEIPALPNAQTQWCAILPRIWRDVDEPRLRTWLERAKQLGVRSEERRVGKEC